MTGLAGDGDAIPVVARVADDEDRDARIQDALDDYLAGRLIKHGFQGDRDAIWSVLSIDIELNAQGLVAWLERREKYNG